MQGAEVAEPGESGAEAGEGEKEPGAAVDVAQFSVLAEGQGDGPGEDDDDRGADGGGQVGVDVGYAEFGQNRRGGCEESGEEGPGDPVHGFMVRRLEQQIPFGNDRKKNKAKDKSKCNHRFFGSAQNDAFFGIGVEGQSIGTARWRTRL